MRLNVEYEILVIDTTILCQWNTLTPECFIYVNPANIYTLAEGKIY